MERTKYKGRYAISELYLVKESNLELFDIMDEEGYDLVTVTFFTAIFKKRK